MRAVPIEVQTGTAYKSRGVRRGKSACAEPLGIKEVRQLSIMVHYALHMSTLRQPQRFLARLFVRCRYVGQED